MWPKPTGVYFRVLLWDCRACPAVGGSAYRLYGRHGTVMAHASAFLKCLGAVGKAFPSRGSSAQHRAGAREEAVELFCPIRTWSPAGLSWNSPSAVG